MNFNLWGISIVICFAYLLTKFTCDAIVCYTCDSISLEACATTLNETELSYEDCSSSTLQCVISIIDSITYRGCSSSTPTSGATYTKSCTENLCNKGVYPPGRLKCYQCNGVDCAAIPIGKPHPCLYHQEVDECYIDVRSATEVFRGCRSDVNHTISSDSIYCDYNGCNNAAATSNLKCAQCDSYEKRGCKMDLMQSNISQYETCEMTVQINDNNACLIYHNLDHVVRGCSDQMDEEVTNALDRVLMCSGPDYCNSGNLAKQQCLQCDSELGDDNCRFNSTAVATTYCSSAEASSCFAVEYTNWQVERGCGVPPVSLDINRQYECDSTSDCNVTPFTRCYQCTSEISTNCASWDRPGYLEIEECQQPGANCLIATFSDGITKRGCESPQLNCSDTSVAHCQLCQGSFCNRGSFPPERLQCYQCGTSENDCAEISADDPLPCPLSDLEPVGIGKLSCFEYFSTRLGHVVRGCASNGLEYYNCMLHSQSACQLCYTNGCNSALSDAFQMNYAIKYKLY